MLLFWGLCLLLAACSQRQARGAERQVLPQDDTEQFWVLDQITASTAGQQQHNTLLLTRSEGSATAFFCGQWNQADSSFKFGTRVSQAGTWSKPGRWPLLASIPSDSLNAAWRFYLHRHAVWLEAGFHSPERQSFKLQGKFEKTDALPVYGDALSPAIRFLPPQTGGFRCNGQAQRAGIFQTAVFVNAGELLQNPQTKAIYYIHLTTDRFEESSYYLLKLDQQDQIEVTAAYRHNRGQWQAISAQSRSGSLQALAPWESPHSRKKYFLQIAYHEPYADWEIAPRSLNQEIQAGKRSFWMGAVAQKPSAEAGRPLIIGNMFIFQR